MDDSYVTGPHDPWTVAVFGAADPRVPIGCGVLVDPQRVLTCRHVVHGKFMAGDPLAITFPKAGVPESVRVQVAEVREGTGADVAMLHLAAPAPPEAVPAPLRSPRPRDLGGQQWWAFGFPGDSEYGDGAYGMFRDPLSYGVVKLEPRSRSVVKHGFSGAGVWSRDFNAVVGLIVQARRGGDNAGEAQAITIDWAALALPDERIQDLTAWSIAVAGDAALEAWGWSLTSDVEAVRHWRPRARGVSIDTEGGYRFRGRRTALTEIVEWVRRPHPDTRVLVVTGSPGVGKSAVLGRIVTTADKGIRAELPADDRNVRAPVGSIACAVHAKGKTALDVATEIARAASVRLPQTVDDLVPALRLRLSQDRARARFNLVIDALDEAANPKQARLIVSALLLPIVRTCSRYGAQVLVGCRRRDNQGILLPAFGPRTPLIDLDEERYFAPEDLEEYALATLALIGAERTHSPYADNAVAAPVARRIATLADRNFLIAGLIARSHGMYDTSAVDPDDLSFTATVDDALAEYLGRLPPVDRVPATTLLTALAYAQAPGVSVDLWHLALDALGVSIPRDALVAFAGSSAANFLVESTNDAGTPRYRLFHQALNDSLLNRRYADGLRQADERALALQLIRHGRNTGWAGVDPYLLRAMPAYAARGGMIDALLTDDSFLLHADLPRLTQLAEYAVSPAARNRARLLRLTPRAITAAPAERAALFGLTAELERLGDTFTSLRSVPYRARWASVASHGERSVLEGYAGAVRAICPINVAGQAHLATVGDYPFVRLWNPTSGGHWEVPFSASTGGAPRPREQFFAVCAVTIRGRTLLAAAGRSNRIYFVDPMNRHPASTLKAHGTIRALCTLTVGPQTYLISGGDDGLVRMWNPTDGRTRTFEGHTGPLRTVTVIQRRGRQLILSGGDDRTARVWDPVDGRLLRTISPHNDIVRAACSVTINGRGSLATTNFTEAKLWSPVTGMESHKLAGHSKVIRGMATIAVGGREALATASADGDVRIWDPEKGDCLRVLSGHTDAITAICTVTIDRHAFLATAGLDRAARLWDLTADDAGQRPARGRRVIAASAVRVNGRQLVATADGDTGEIQLQDVETGATVRKMQGLAAAMDGMCTVRDGRDDVIAAVSGGSVLQIWDATTGGLLVNEINRFRKVQAICPFRAEGGTSLLAIAGNRRPVIQYCRPDTGRPLLRRLLPNLFVSNDVHDHLDRLRVVHQLAGSTTLVTAGNETVVLWSGDGRYQGSLEGHRRAVGALASLPTSGRSLLASGSDDQTIRIWDPDRRLCLATLTGHTDAVNAVCPVTVDGRTVLASGSLDRTVRLWDLSSLTLLLTIPVHHPVLACLEVSGLLFVGLTAGSLALDVNAGSSELLSLREIGVA